MSTVAWWNPFQRSVAAAPLALPEGAALAAAPARGITGTANFSGQLRTEEKPELSHTRAFGIAGTLGWGEWERIGKTNPFIAMALDFVCQPIRDATWAVEPAKDAADGQKHADFVAWVLKECLAQGLNEVLAIAAEGSQLAGFALFERVWEVRDTPWGKARVLARLAERLPSSITINGWREGPSNDLEAVEQRGPKNDGTSAWANVLLPSQDLVLFSWKRRGNNYQGVSAFRSVYYPAKVMEMLVRLVGVSLQREGAGVPIAYAEDRESRLTDAAREKLEQFLANLVMHEGASAVMPAGYKMEWVYSPGANKGHVVDAYNALGKVILQRLQAQQMVLGVDGTGSRSVGETHARASLSYVQGVVAFLEGVCNGTSQRPYEGFVHQLVDAKFGPQSAYPQLSITLRKPQLDPLVRANATKVAVDAGLFTVTHRDENVMREELGFEPIDEAERAHLHAEKKAMAATIAGNLKAEDDEVDDEVDDETEMPTSDAPAKKLEASAKRGPWVASRPLRASEAYLAPEELVAFLDGARESFEREVKPVVVEMLVRAQPDITAAMADGDPSEVAALPLETKRLEGVVGAFLERTRAEGARHVKAELGRATAARRLTAAEEDDKEPQATPPAPPASPPIVAETSKLVQAQTKALVRRMTSRLRGELETEAIDAVRTGADASEVTSRTVAKQLDSGAFRSDAGTATTRVWNLGRDEAARLVGATEVEYSAILDDATCATCADFDGRRARVGSEEHDDMLPPNRDCDGRGNCRCLLVYVPGQDTEESDE